jgi:CheY-like chemotaxis protein
MEASDGEEALSVARQHHPDLILLDVMMPKIDGIEVCRQRSVGTLARRLSYMAHLLSSSCPELAHDNPIPSVLCGQIK